MILDEIINDLKKDKTEQYIGLFLFVGMIVAGYFEYGLKGVLTPFMMVVGLLGTMTGIQEIFFLIVKKERISNATYILLPLTIGLYIYWFVTGQNMAIALFLTISLVIIVIMIVKVYITNK